MPLLTVWHGTESGPPPPPEPPEYPHRTVSAQLLDYDGTPVAGDPLALAFGVNWYDEWDGPGRGGVSLSLSEAGAAELLPGRYVNCVITDEELEVSTVRFTFKIEGNPEYRHIQRGEEHDQIVTVQGRGWACVLDEAVTFPEYALPFSLETTWRLFSFASKLFPNIADWDPAVELAEYLDGVTEAACYGHWQQAPDGLPYPAPIGFPWPTNPFNLVAGVPTANYEDTFWIITADQPDYASTGYLFFKGQFSLDDLTAVRFTATGDNFFTLFLEGVPILGEQISIGNHFMWQGWKDKTIWLPAGDYDVAGAVYNISFTDLGGGPKVQPPCLAQGYDGSARDGNPAGLLCSIFEPGDSATAPTAILMSNSSWISHYDEFYWPGWTPGQIIDQLIMEGIANGSLTVYSSNTYDDDTDSDGEDWRPFDEDYERPDIPTFAIEVGTSLMQALQLMQQRGWIHWHVQPGTFILDLYRARLPASPVPAAILAGEANLIEFTRSATAPYANALLVQWEGGYVTVEDVAAITAYGTTVWGTYSSDTGSADEARLDGNNELFIRAQAQFPAIVAEVEPLTDNTVPYEAFELGDYVTVPAQGGGTEDVRCLSITCQQDALGYAVWKTELNAKLDVPQRRNDQLLQQIGGKNQIVRGTVN